VADAAGIHRQLLGRKLNGHTTVSMEDVASIARAIDMSPAELAPGTLLLSGALNVFSPTNREALDAILGR